MDFSASTAERIRGELLKLDIRVAKWTVQKYMRDARQPRRAGQTWATFLRNHGDAIWACDFLPVTDLLFRPVYAFFVIALGSRRVVHVGVTRHPTDAWVAQQLREATPLGQRPKYLIRDNDCKFGQAFNRVAAANGFVELRMAYRAPRQNATCERFLGTVCMVFVPRDPSGLLHLVTPAPATVATVRVLPRGSRGGETARGHEVRKLYTVRRECLDHVIVLGEGQLRRILREYVAFFNTARPHQGLRQRVPADTAGMGRWLQASRKVRAVPVLGGLHHTYQRAA